MTMAQMPFEKEHYSIQLQLRLDLLPIRYCRMRKELTRVERLQHLCLLQDLVPRTPHIERTLGEGLYGGGTPSAFM